MEKVCKACWLVGLLVLKEDGVAGGVENFIRVD
jgi:hypothetical protein